MFVESKVYCFRCVCRATRIFGTDGTREKIVILRNKFICVLARKQTVFWKTRHAHYTHLSSWFLLEEDFKFYPNSSVAKHFISVCCESNIYNCLYPYFWCLWFALFISITWCSSSLLWAYLPHITPMNLKCIKLLCRIN